MGWDHVWYNNDNTAAASTGGVWNAETGVGARGLADSGRLVGDWPVDGDRPAGAAPSVQLCFPYVAAAFQGVHGHRPGRVTGRPPGARRVGELLGELVCGVPP